MNEFTCDDATVTRVSEICASKIQNELTGKKLAAERAGIVTRALESMLQLAQFLGAVSSLAMVRSRDLPNEF